MQDADVKTPEKRKVSDKRLFDEQTPDHNIRSLSVKAQRDADEELIDRTFAETSR